LQVSERRILNYWLVEELGHDRLGRVYRAEPAHDDGTVIVRLLRVADVVAADRVEAARSALRQRVRAAAAVFHPSLVGVLDFFPHLDLEVLAIEDVRGESLAELAARAELLPADEALRHASDIAGAVAAAHARSVTHGRITPANIRIGRDRKSRLLDLGIPRPTDGAFHLAERPSGDAEAVARRHDVLALGRSLQLLLTGTSDAAALRLAASVPGVRGAAWQAVARVLLGRDPSAALLREALIDVARSTPAKQAEAEPVVPIVLVHLPEQVEDEPKATPSAVPTAGPEQPARTQERHEVMLPRPRARRNLVATAAARFRRSVGRLVTRSATQFAASAFVGALLVIGAIAVIGRPQLPRGSTSNPPGSLAATSAPTETSPEPGTAFAEEQAPEAPAPESTGPLPLWGTLRVSVEQRGARVSLDGGPWRPAPVTYIDLQADRYELLISLPGFLSRRDTVTVSAGTTTRRLYTLAPER
jgi:serine/threonine-protein kinase